MGPIDNPSLARLFRKLGPTIVISKKGDHPRKRKITATLEAAGIPYEFLDATMGAGLSPARIAEIYDEQAAINHKTISRRLDPSHIGCSWSHKRLYREVADRGLASAVVLEDDAIPVPGRSSAGAERALSELPADWDLLYLGIRGHRRAPWAFPFKLYLFLPWARLLFPRKYRLAHAECSRLYLRPFSAHLYRAGYHQGTHAYAVSRKGAERLLHHIGRIQAPADVALATLVIEGRLNAFVLHEDLFTTTGDASQILSALGGKAAADGR